MTIKSYISKSVMVLAFVVGAKATAGELLENTWEAASSRGKAMAHLVEDESEAFNGDTYWNMEGSNGRDSRQKLRQEVTLPENCSAHGLGRVQASAWFAGVDESEVSELDQAKLLLRYNSGNGFITQAATDWVKTKASGNFIWQQHALTNVAIPEGVERLSLVAVGKPIGADDSSVDVAWDNFSLTRNCVVDFAKIKGSTQTGKRGNKSIEFNGVVATLEDGTTNGSISIAYKALHTVCDFIPESINYKNGNAIVKTSYECTGKKFGGGEATIVVDGGLEKVNSMVSGSNLDQIEVITDDADLDIDNNMLVSVVVNIQPGDKNKLKLAMR